jgi:hypothetical protein
MPKGQGPRAPISRTPSTRRLKATVSYDFHTAAKLIDVHKNAIRRWAKSGGLLVDRAARPHRVRGDVLKAFLAARKQSRRQPLKTHEFHCFKCREPREAYGRLVDAFPMGPKRLRLTGQCEQCGTTVNKVQAAAKLPKLREQFDFLQQALERLSVSVNPNLNGHLGEQS